MEWDERRVESYGRVAPVNLQIRPRDEGGGVAQQPHHRFGQLVGRGQPPYRVRGQQRLLCGLGVGLTP
jgi:hypothetical protein